jgi:hypothetical protein
MFCNEKSVFRKGKKIVRFWKGDGMDSYDWNCGDIFFLKYFFKKKIYIYIKIIFFYFKKLK